MMNIDFWKRFYSTGKIKDYIKYSQAKNQEKINMSIKNNESITNEIKNKSNNLESDPEID